MLKFIPFILILFLAGCQMRLTPQSYLIKSETKHNRVSVSMDYTMRLTPTKITIDSIVLFNKIVDKIFSDRHSNLFIELYYNGAGPKDYSDARVSCLKLEQLLIERGYPDSRISYDAKFYVSKKGEIRYPYYKVNFVINSQ